jgi:hypothetical protein
MTTRFYHAVHNATNDASLFMAYKTIFKSNFTTDSNMGTLTLYRAI